MSLDPKDIIAADETVARLKQLIRAGVTTPTQIGEGVFPEKQSRLACALICNWLGNRRPGPQSVILLRKWIAAKERQMQRLTAAK